MKDINRLGIDWLNKNFGYLTEVVKGSRTYYVDENRLPLFFYYQDEKNGTVYLNYDRIWSFFELVFRYNYQQIQGLTKTWLEETYNLRGKTPQGDFKIRHKWLEETYNLRGKTPYFLQGNFQDGWKRPII